jgi:methyl-accepting chemotaxis protein
MKQLLTKVRLKPRTHELNAKLAALDKSQAVIEFDMNGNILSANPNFCTTVGYTLDEIKGKHHSMFVDEQLKNSMEYRQFWESLRRGEYQAAEYKRFGRNGKEVWIQASYNPIFGKDGKPVKVVKYATETTSQKLQTADFQGQLNAIKKSQAVIEFNLDGTILNANENFCGAVGYTLDEIKGKHHSLFVDNDFKNSAEYKKYWEALGRGEYQAAQYRRFGKGGKEIWIQASYNPIFDPSGKPYKVVKYATDITKQATLVNTVKHSLSEIDKALSNALQQSSSAAAAAVQTSANVQMVASGAEELNASVQEISTSMTKSRDATEKAAKQARDAEAATMRLTQTAQAMTSIVDLIQNIASQINLLSLNATIESARAGEAGRGFAVVAGEVKNLAKQAADATEKIGQEIAGIQEISNAVAESLNTIKQSVENVREYVTGTAAAVEEQSAVSREMSSNMQTASEAVATISVNLTEIEKSTRMAGESMQDTKKAAEALE